MTAEERERYLDRLLQERLEEQGLIPLQTIDNSLRGRLGRGLRRGPVSSRDQISNRRTRRHDLSVSTTAPLLPSSAASEPGTWTPRRPGSARTVASSIGQHSFASPLNPYSVSSPLSPNPHLAPPLPIVPSTPRSATVVRTPHTPRAARTQGVSATQRSFSSPVMSPPAISDPGLPYLPPVGSLIMPSPLPRSLRIYKAEIVARERLANSDRVISFSSLLNAVGLDRRQ